MRASPLSTEVDSAGLTGHEAARLLAEVGPNTLPEPAVRSLPRLVAAALTDPLVLVLLVAGVLTLATGDRPDTAVIALVVVINTVVTVRQNGHADDAVRALRTLQSPTCRVLRDGVEQALAAAALVPGDVVLLDEGDLVPADAVVLRAVALLVDESTVTGESVAVDKTAAGATAAGGTPGADATVLAGTAVVHGHGIVRVVATGTRSTLGQVAGLLQGPAQRTPLQRRMARLSLLIAAVAVLACSVVLLLGWWRGQDLELMVLTAVSLAVAAVPESLPAVVTITLSLAARRMAGRHAVVRDLAAAETLGSVTLLATDKTGTLTCAQMQVTQWWTAPGATEEQLRTAVRLCNDARLGEDGQHAGDPTEIALLVAARDAGGDAVAEPVRVAEVPFDSVRKRMTTVHRVDGGHLVVVKGAPDHVLTAGVLRVSDATLAAAVSRSESLSREGLRVLAVAQRSTPGPGVPADVDTGLDLLGLVALQDPPRSSAAAAVQRCRRAGVRVVLVTGDNVLTAASIAQQVGVTDGPARVLDLANRPLHDAPGLDVDVIARATPRDKLEAVRSWQEQGHVVAMIGDGVNDAPALRRAAIGVALGGRGTEVARQAADLVIADDELQTVVAAIEEGRRVYTNIRRFLLYGLSGGAAEVLVMLLGPGLGMALPLLPAQILWINLLTHSLTGTALGAEPVELDAMTRPPRSPHEGVLGGGLWWRLVILTLLVTAAAFLTARTGVPQAEQSALMVGLGAAMLGVALGARARRPGPWRLRQGHVGLRNPALPLSVAACAALLVLAVELPALRALLTTMGPGWPTYVAATAGGVLAALVTRAVRVS